MMQSFIEYANSEHLTADEIYTLELLIASVQSSFDPQYWIKFDEANDARNTRSYRPRFLKQHIEPAAELLQQKTWLSLQRVQSSRRPVRDIRALQFVPKLTTLVLRDNLVKDLQPLTHCRLLRELILGGNPVKDLQPLTQCPHLQSLDISNIPATDLTALERMAALSELTLLAKQVAALNGLRSLPTLKRLEFNWAIRNRMASFEDFPEMPELREIRGAHVKSLSGLQRYPKLESLVNLTGPVESLEPLRQSKSLTYINISGSKIDSLEPLSELTSLRELHITTSKIVNLRPLETLSMLHAVSLGGRDHPTHPELAEFVGKLTTWDTEFLSDAPRYQTNCQIEVVDEATFQYYDSEARYNFGPSDNQSLLSSELAWLEDRLQRAFEVHFVDTEDFTVPVKWTGGRSCTVVLYSDKAMQSFRQIVATIQTTLAQATNDWIIYLHSDGPEPAFIAWVYPEKIVITKEHEQAVRELLSR